VVDAQGFAPIPTRWLLAEKGIMGKGQALMKC